MAEKEQIKQKAEEYCQRPEIKMFGANRSQKEVELIKQTFINGYQECEKEHEWHNINIEEPSDKQLGKQLLIRMESVTGDTDYDYLVYKYTGESITDVPGVIAWKEIEK